jgi:hypothetical protein
MSKPSHPTTILGAFESKKLKMGSGQWCQTNHDNVDTRKFASYALFILGKPSGFLCVRCNKEWKELWKELSPVEYV